SAVRSLIARFSHETRTDHGKPDCQGDVSNFYRMAQALHKNLFTKEGILMTKQFLRTAATLFISICAAPTVVRAAPVITNLGNIPGGDETFGFALSGNGTTVVG